MFEVCFLHEIEYVLAVECDAMDDLDLLGQFCSQWEDLFDVDTFGPSSWQINAAIDCIG